MRRYKNYEEDIEVKEMEESFEEDEMIDEIDEDIETDLEDNTESDNINDDYELGYEAGRRAAMRELNESSHISAWHYITVNIKELASDIKELIKDTFTVYGPLGRSFLNLQPLTGGRLTQVSVNYNNSPTFVVSKTDETGEKKEFLVDDLEGVVNKAKELNNIK